MPEEREVAWNVTALYGARTREPLVQVTVGDREIIMSPEQAREIVVMLLEASFAAEADAALFELGSQIIPGGDDRTGGALITMMREWREKRELALANEVPPHG